MRILVLQLARFGDIYQSWPTWRALKRRYPEAELHVLVRERFRAAADSFPGIKVHALPTREILRPLVEDGRDEDALMELENFFAPLHDAKFDWIINLTFSPLSSYIADWLAQPTTKISGYTRHADGHFNVLDDTSAYFHAQAGVGRANRYHVTDLFAAVAEVELALEDFHTSNVHQRHGIAVHLAASTAEKSYPPELWIEALKQIRQQTSEPIVLIGSEGERALSEAVSAQLINVDNLVGRTNMQELFTAVERVKVLIGSDSAPIHVAALTATPVLNLSCDFVNFWETGPYSAGSRVLHAEEISAVKPQRIAEEALAMCEGRGPQGPCFLKPNLFETYHPHETPTDGFSWALIQALYTDASYPEATTVADKLTFQRLFELAELALQQLARWQDQTFLPTAAKILQQIDVMLGEVSRLSPRIDPVIQWFETQRLRIPPGSDEATLESTRKCFQDLYLVTSVYRTPDDDEAKLRARAVEMCAICVPEIRECNLSGVSDSFQTLVSTLHDLARYSTKVANQSWSSVLAEMNRALEIRDYIQLADLLQWKLAPELSRLTEQETLKSDVIS